MSESFNLQRFVDAQDGVYAQALEEISSAQKQSHWMWFIFPQLAGLGHSATANYYAIRSVDEARDYLQHPLLGSRLFESTRAAIDCGARDSRVLFGYPDNLKFHSCMTLFSEVDKDNKVFNQALDVFFHGEKDQRSLAILREMQTRLN